MHIITLPDETTKELSEYMHDRLLNSAYRSPGVHLSDILNKIEQALYSKNYDKKTNGTNNWYASIGFIWEQVLTISLGDLLGPRPPEIIKDDIACSPDGYNKKLNLIEEIKCTWKNCDKDSISDRWRWLMQIKAYCHIMGCDCARLHVLYMRGNYKDLYGPVYRVFMLHFTQEELTRNWDLLVYQKQFL